MTYDPIAGANAWTRDSIEPAGRWRFALTADDIAEIDAALVVPHRRDVAWPEVTIDDFPLDGLAEKLAAISDELESGSGMARLSGLPIERYDEMDLRRLWWGMSLHLGQPVHQDFQDQLMRDIVNLAEDTDARYGHRMTDRAGETFVSSKARTLSNGPLRYHTDRCDVAALLSVHAAPICWRCSINPIRARVLARNKAVKAMSMICRCSVSLPAG